MKEEMQVWLEALRSGKFEQGMGVLYEPYDNTYCCLGVADAVVFGEDFDSGGYDSKGKCAALDPEYANILGLDKKVTPEEISRIKAVRQLYLPLDGEWYRERILSSLNDMGVSFKALADLIEKLGWDRV